MEIVKIIRETEKEEFEVNEGGVLFATKSCTIKGNLYSAGPIIALGDLKIEGKIISEISIMVAKTLQAQHSISACFIMASNIKCKGIVQAPVPLSMRRILWRPFRFPLNEICQLREKGDLGKISVWGKITAGGICGVIIRCEKEILSFGRVEANSKIECGKNIISKKDIIAGVPFDPKHPRTTTFAVINSGGSIESGGNIFSEGDIIAGDYIRANGIIKAGNRILVKKKGEISAGFTTQNTRIPSIIAREIIGTIKHGTLKKLEI